MRTRSWHPICALLLSILTLAAPSFAQTERGFVEGVGGFAVSAASTSPRVTSGDWSFDAGARIAPGLLAFGDVGRINDLTPSTSESAIASTVTTLSSADAVDVVGSTRMPARYALGGLRWEPRTPRRLVPFALGVFTPPAASNALMITAGGGVELAMASHWAMDTEYRVSRISATTPLHTQGLAFGLGYRF